MSRLFPGLLQAVPGRRRTAPGTKQVTSPGRWSVRTVSITILLITQVIMYEVFPHFTKEVEFDLVLRKFWYWGPWLVLVLGVLRYAVKRQVDVFNLLTARYRRPLAVIATLSVIIGAWDVLLKITTDLVTYHTYASGFTSRKELIPSAPEFLRYTPLQNACTDIGNSVSSTGQHINCEYVQPMITNHGFAYVAPITPSGLINTFYSKNPGFMVLDDSAQASSDPRKRLRRVDEEQYYGQGMEWFDNLNYVLAKTDFFADYDTPHFLALDPQKPDTFTMVVPKIKYGFLWRLPYWGGVTLVHSNGKIEDLTAEAAVKDKRLAGKWIYPMSLARRYVYLQNYAAGHGLFTPVARLEGLFEIEELPGENQFPFLTQGGDGRPYLVTATKGQGSAQGLFRMYYVDASTGAGSYHEFDPHEVVYGARASLNRVKNLPGYQWYDGKNGVITAIEPVYVVRPNDPVLRWKFTVTTVEYTGISATPIVNASRPDEIIKFTDRDAFEKWVQGEDVEPLSSLPTEVSPRTRLLKALDGLTEQVEKLRRDVEALPQ